jgi:hypothetical protein
MFCIPKPLHPTIFSISIYALLSIINVTRTIQKSTYPDKMVAIQTIRASNARIAGLPEGLVGLFLGATSGIGQSALKQFVQYAVKPRVYIVARRAAAATELLAGLRAKNPHGTYEIIEKNVSLIKETDEVVEIVKAKETKLDILFMTVGFISFEGRQGTHPPPTSQAPSHWQIPN